MGIGAVSHRWTAAGVTERKASGLEGCVPVGGEAWLWLADGNYKTMPGGKRDCIVNAFLWIGKQDRS